MDLNYITEEERAEYLAYHSYSDVINNFERGMQDLKRFDFSIYRDRYTLICGGMMAFDKGIADFLNRWNGLREDLFLLSEVTAQYRRYTKEQVHMPYICTPHLLAKEMIILQMNIPVTKQMLRLYRKKKYIREAVCNLEMRHKSLGEGYGIAWGYFAYAYISLLLKGLKPQKVVLWNEFYAFHHIFRGICVEKRIPVHYIEFGCLPGTICIEGKGQQGESYPATRYRQFRTKKVSSGELQSAKQVLDFLKQTGLNRNKQPLQKIGDVPLRHFKQGKKTILYMGQNDFESGICPYTKRTKKFHSPSFHTSLEALEFLRRLTIKNDWNLIYKPHPIMVALNHSGMEFAQKIDIVTDIDINSMIDGADLVVTIFSQSAYIALIRRKPVLMLGYTQLRGKGCTYEAFSIGEIESQIHMALENGFTKEQQDSFVCHTTQLLKYYLYDDGVERALRFGKRVENIGSVTYNRRMEL